MSLPYEILDAVTKLVHKEDHDAAALKVLSLASPTFRDLCQRLLFQSIKLYVRSYAGIYDPAKTPAYLVRFHHVVTQSPRIASYVRELNIAQYSVCPSGGHFQSAMWMLDHPDLLIGILHALRSSRVHAISIVSRGGVEWTKLDDRLQRSFLHIFQNSCFKSISLRGIRIPGHFFSAFKSLHSVELFNPTFPPGTNDVPPSTHTHQISHLAFRAHPHNNINSPRNNDFHLVGPSSRLVGPIIGLDLSQLTSLELDTNLVHLPSLTHLLQSSSLTDLRVSISQTHRSRYHSTPPVPPTLDLSRLPRLTRLSLCNNCFGTSFVLIANALGTITTAQSRLESLEFYVLTKAITITETRNLAALPIPLAQSLSSLHRGAGNLRRILFHVKVCRSNGYDAQNRNAKTVILESLKWEGCEGVLEVQMETSPQWYARIRHDGVTAWP